MNIGTKQTKLRQSIKQAGLFACVGVLAVFFDFVVYTSLIKSFGLTTSKIFGFYGGVIISFLGNSLLTFRKVNQPPLAVQHFGALCYGLHDVDGVECWNEHSSDYRNADGAF